MLVGRRRPRTLRPRGFVDGHLGVCQSSEAKLEAESWRTLLAVLDLITQNQPVSVRFAGGQRMVAYDLVLVFRQRR